MSADSHIQIHFVPYGETQNLNYLEEWNGVKFGTHRQ